MPIPGNFLSFLNLGGGGCSKKIPQKDGKTGLNIPFFIDNKIHPQVQVPAVSFCDNKKSIFNPVLPSFCGVFFRAPSPGVQEGQKIGHNLEGFATHKKSFFLEGTTYLPFKI